MQSAEREARSIEDFFEGEGYSFTGGIDLYHVTITWPDGPLASSLPPRP